MWREQTGVDSYIARPGKNLETGGDYFEQQGYGKVAATENCICFRTVSRNRKSPRRFCVTRDEFAKLKTQASVTTHDGWCFTVLRRDARTDTLEIQFTWLSGSNYALTGWEETITLPYTRLAAFVEDSAQEGRTRDVEGAFRGYPKRKPQLVFDSKETLRAILNNGVVRRNLVRFLRDNFNWPSSEQVHFYRDFVP